MNLNKRKVVLNIINSRKDKLIVPEVVNKVESKVEKLPVKEELPVALKDIELPKEEKVAVTTVEEPAVVEQTSVDHGKNKKNKKVVESEEQK